MSVVEIPSYIAIIFTLDLLGRRTITSSLMLIGGMCCIVASYIEQGSTVATVVVMIGNSKLNETVRFVFSVCLKTN